MKVIWVITIFFTLILGSYVAIILDEIHIARSENVADTRFITSFGYDNVILLQKALQRTGYYQDKTNGILNAGTKRALREFQQQHHLMVTGEPDDATLALLGLRGSSPDSTRTAHGAKPEETVN